jgi:hypothetical protein
MSRTRAALAVALLLTAAAHEVTALTVYVRRAVVLEQGPVTIGDMVQPVGELSRDVLAALQRPVDTLGDRALLLPVTLYRSQLAGTQGGDLIVVGKRTLVVPRGSPADGALALFDRLADRMQELGWLGPGRVEIEVERMSGQDARQGLREPVFTVLRADRRPGPLSGEVEIGFRGTADSGDPSSGRITLRLRQDTAPDAAAADPQPGEPGVRANDPVLVEFRKGAVTVEMPGRAAASAEAGDHVTVFVPDARRSFSGILVEGKVVSVEVP